MTQMSPKKNLFLSGLWSARIGTTRAGGASSPHPPLLAIFTPFSIARPEDGAPHFEAVGRATIDSECRPNPRACAIVPVLWLTPKALKAESPRRRHRPLWVFTYGTGNKTKEKTRGRAQRDAEHKRRPTVHQCGLGSRCPLLQREVERAPWWVQGKALPGDRGWNPRTTAG